jgi:hypothetical protein
MGAYRTRKWKLWFRVFPSTSTVFPQIESPLWGDMMRSWDSMKYFPWLVGFHLGSSWAFRFYIAHASLHRHAHPIKELSEGRPENGELQQRDCILSLASPCFFARPFIPSSSFFAPPPPLVLSPPSLPPYSLRTVFLLSRWQLSWDANRSSTVQTMRPVLLSFLPSFLPLIPFP